ATNVIIKPAKMAPHEIRLKNEGVTAGVVTTVCAFMVDSFVRPSVGAYVQRTRGASALHRVFPAKFETELKVLAAAECSEGETGKMPIHFVPEPKAKRQGSPKRS